MDRREKGLAGREPETYLFISLMTNRYCLIDIGTNNVLLLLAEIDTGEYHIIKRLNRISALAEGMEAGNLSKDGIDRVKNILREYITIAEKYDAEPVLIGTSALREAENRYILEDWLEKEYSIPLRLITGDEEARLNGIANINEFTHENILLFDIGGGSTEFTLITKGEIRDIQSIDLGIRRFHNRFGDEAYQEVGYLRLKLNLITIRIPSGTMLVGIGGTVTSLAAMLQNMTVYNENKVHKYQITKVQLDKLFSEIANTPEDQVLERIAFNPLSKALLMAGGIIVREIIAHFNASNFFVSDRTWQYGVLKEIITGRYVV
ncbi:MAG: hypothetical protein P9X26_01270 [Candidatus Stygibacter frigidus]|nr:hypothetical protein [Candidatus Stygibacter frigidus]